MMVLLNRMFRGEDFGSRRTALVDCFMHWWHTKKSRDSLGAARRIPGNKEAIGDEEESERELKSDSYQNGDYVIMV
jgi:hypothetical protein